MRSIWPVAAAAGVLLAASAAPGSASAAVVGEVAGAATLRAEAGRKGKVRVIARLKAAGSGSRAESATERSAAAAAAHGELAARMAGAGVAEVERLGGLPLVALEADPGQIDALVASGRVEAVGEDRLLRPVLAQSVPLVEAPAAWAAGFDGTGQAVAILDTGVDRDHPFLKGKVVAEACFSSNVPSREATSLCPGGLARRIGAGAGRPCPDEVDYWCLHGTHVAGIAVGKGGGRAPGVAPGAKLVAIQVFSRFDDPDICGGFSPCALAFTSDIIEGLDHVRSLAAAGRVRIAAANLSLGGGRSRGACDDDPEKVAIDALRSLGVATVIASGNEGYQGALNSPGCVSTAITVGATTDTGGERVADFSNASPVVDLLAPGVSIRSSVPGRGFGTFDGTSMAAPHVAGAWAILRSAAPGASVARIERAVESTGRRVAGGGGPGVPKPRLDVAKALRALGG